MSFMRKSGGLSGYPPLTPSLFPKSLVVIFVLITSLSLPSLLSSSSQAVDLGFTSGPAAPPGTFGRPPAAVLDKDAALDAAAAAAEGPPEVSAMAAAVAAHATATTTNDPLTDDTDADEDAWAAGSGPRGEGDPMRVGKMERERTLCDGAGLCSPGRWPPWRRPVARNWRVLALRGALARAILSMDGPDGGGIEKLFAALSKGEVLDSPFPIDLVTDLTAYAESLFDDDGEGGARERPGDVAQPVRVRLVQALLRAVGDPDSAGMSHFAAGVRLGVGVRLPRTPAVYARKTRWRLPEQAGADHREEPSTEAIWRDNYRSAKASLAAIEVQLEDHHHRGLADRVPEAEAELRYPGLRVSSLGAVEKLGSPGDVRIVMDGSRGVDVNTAIRVRDQDRCPTSADVKRLQREQDATRRGLGLAVDIHEAHRLPRVHRSDWRFQACQARPGGPVYVYRVGVFGIASIAYWWSRLGGAAIRLLLYLADGDMELWAMLMADDIKLEATGPYPRRCLLWALLCLTVLGYPLAWRKIHGGDVVRWIGYEVDIAGLRLGVTEARAQWAVTWCLRVARDGQCRIDDFRAALGRLGFIAGALEFERPFLAPLYAFLARAAGDGPRTLPLYVTTVLVHLATRFAARRLYPSTVKRVKTLEAFRVDAHADGDVVGVGGWLPARDAQGAIDTARSNWFSVSLTRESAPWAYSRGEPFRTIAALEALGVLLALMAFTGDVVDNQDVALLIPGVTDNRGNAYVLDRLMTTRFPLCAVVMELAAQMERKNVRVGLDWCPRELNSEADALANGDFTRFNPDYRIDLDVTTTDWLVLNDLMRHGEAHERAKRNEPPRPRATAKAKRKPKWARLRVTDPW